MFVYEYLIEKLRSPSIQRSFHYKEDSVENLRTAIAGACAGMLSWLPGIPFDVIKTKMMTATTPDQYKSVFHCFSVITKVKLLHNLSIYFISVLVLLHSNDMNVIAIFDLLSIVYLQEHGYKYLFRGGSVLLLRSAPISAVSFIAYENMLRYCQNRRTHEQFS